MQRYPIGDGRCRKGPHIHHPQFRSGDRPLQNSPRLRLSCGEPATHVAVSRFTVRCLAIRPRAGAARSAECRRSGNNRARRAYRCGRAAELCCSEPSPDTISAISFWRGFRSPTQATDRDGLVALEAERLPRRAFLEHQRQHAHADQIRAMDALEALRDHGADAEQTRALRRPVARGAGAVFLAGEHHERHLLLLVLHRGVVDRHLLAVGIVLGDAAFGRCPAPSA